MQTSLVFHSTTFDVIDRNGDPWLRGLQVASALGYKNPGADIRNLYERHSDEFTADMTALVKLPTEGGEQEVRIFSPRGCYALAMFARTKVAKAFRKWVLDVLESIRKTGRYEVPATKKALPGKLTAESQDLVKAAIRQRVEALPREKWSSASMTLWGAIGTKFGTRGMKDGYKNIPEEALSEIMSLIARTPLSGEYIPAEDEVKKAAMAMVQEMALGKTLLAGMPARRLSAEAEALGEMSGAAHSISIQLKHFNSMADAVEKMAAELKMAKLFASDIIGNLTHYREKAHARIHDLDAMSRQMI